MSKKFYDNTMLSYFKKCPRMSYFRVERDWVRDKTEENLAFGSGWHNSQDVIWKNYTKMDLDDLIEMAVAGWEISMAAAQIDYESPQYNLETFRTAGTVREMIRNYITQRKYYLERMEVLAVEQPFAVPIDEKGETFYVGRLDKVVRFEGHEYIIEHKTTSKYKKDGPFQESWLGSFSPNSQIDGYLLAGSILYPKTFKAVWVDGALVHKTVHDGFKFVPVEKALSMIDSFLVDTTYWIAQFEMQKKMLSLLDPEGDFLAFFKNTEWCWMCSYTPICRFIKDPRVLDVPEGYRHEHWEPYDILRLEELGL